MTSAAAMSLFLDREGHKKFLKATTIEELTTKNQELTERVLFLEDELMWLYEARRADNIETAVLQSDLDLLQQESAAVQCQDDEIELLKSRFETILMNDVMLMSGL